MKMQHSKNSLYGILSALMLLNVALIFSGSAHAQYQSKLPKCDGLNSNKWDLCYGEETSRNGVSYKGEYKDGYRHGFGEITYGNRERYVGQFVQGRSEGRGVLFAADGRKLKEGAWENNEFVEVSSAELEERRRKAELEKLQGDLAAAKKAQLEAERGKAEAENARKQAEANANVAKMRAESEQRRTTAAAEQAEQKLKADLEKQQLELATWKKAQADPKDVLFKKNLLWSSKQAQGGKCSDIVRQSKSTFAEIFSGFSPESLTYYFAFTNSTQQMFRNEPENMNKHLSHPASSSFNKDAVSITVNNGKYSLIKDYKINTSTKTITETNVQCLGNNPECEKGITTTKMQLEQQKKTNSFEPLYACIDDLPNRDMFGGSPIERLKNGEGVAFYEDFICSGGLSQETAGREFATSLIKHLKTGNQSAYNAQLSKSKQIFTSVEFMGRKMEMGCSKLGLTKDVAPNGSRILIEQDDNLDLTIYRNSGAAAFAFTGVVERRK